MRGSMSWTRAAAAACGDAQRASPWLSRPEPRAAPAANPDQYDADVVAAARVQRGQQQVVDAFLGGEVGARQYRGDPGIGQFFAQAIAAQQELRAPFQRIPVGFGTQCRRRGDAERLRDTIAPGRRRAGLGCSFGCRARVGRRIDIPAQALQCAGTP
jgi:hypothetical protein